MSYVIMILGLVTLLTCAMGFYGGYKQNRFLLTIYLFFLFSTMVILLCMGVFLYQYEDGDVLDELVEESWFEESDDARFTSISSFSLYHIHIFFVIAYLHSIRCPKQQVTARKLPRLFRLLWLAQ